jgi:hypothetical protein
VRCVTYCLHSRLLRKAAELHGGARALGYALQVPAPNLARWMAGLEPMPRPVFLKVVDLVLGLTSDGAATPLAQPAQRRPYAFIG